VSPKAPQARRGTIKELVLFYVYLLQSERFENQRYVGFTQDLKHRIAAHNSGSSRHTAKFRPWSLSCYVAFEEETMARDFERYMKTGSGQAFANKRLWPQVQFDSQQRSAISEPKEL
jgi:putative endonuclease